jgi:cold-inducible RNA-binding protein
MLVLCQDGEIGLDFFGFPLGATFRPLPTPVPVSSELVRRDISVTKLFVGNLPYKATETDLQSFFAEAGVQVDSVNILRDRFSGEPRGFGFVEINDDAVANQAVQTCNGRALMGRALVVNEARPQERRERSQGGGGGGRQRDFGGSRNRW